MTFKKHNRQYDLVVLGATGYTGALTAQQIANTFPVDLKWAVAGRSADKLKQLVTKCQSLQSNRTQPAIEVCNVNEEELAALSRKTFCLITTLGPYTRYGEPAFKACAEAGTHYMDCTGEVPFTLDMIQKYEAAAQASGAWMFPQSGLESVPSDVLTWLLASTVRSQLSAQTSDVVLSLHQFDFTPSGGTLASFMTMFELFPIKTLLQALEPYALAPIKNNTPRPKKSFITSITGLVNQPGLGLLTTSTTGAMNAAIVFRTWGLMKREPSLEKELYGPRFTYQEFMNARNVLFGIIVHYGLIMSAALLLCSPVRALMRKVVFKPGEGPDTEKSKNERMVVRGVAKPDIETGAKNQVYGTFSYTGGMYNLTAVFLAAGAASILEDNTVKLTGGIYTPSCLGQGYIDRLQGAGVEFETEIRDV